MTEYPRAAIALSQVIEPDDTADIFAAFAELFDFLFSHGWNSSRHGNLSDTIYVTIYGGNHYVNKNVNSRQNVGGYPVITEGKFVRAGKFRTLNLRRRHPRVWKFQTPCLPHASS